MNIDAKIIALIPDLDRDSCMFILGYAGIVCYESEETYTLREAIEANYKDGTIRGGTICHYYFD